MAKEFDPNQLVEIARNSPEYLLSIDLLQYPFATLLSEDQVYLLLHRLLEPADEPEKSTHASIVILEGDTTPSMIYDAFAALIALGQPPISVLSLLLHLLVAPDRDWLPTPKEVAQELRAFSQEQSQIMSAWLIKQIQQAIVAFNNTYIENQLFAVIETDVLATSSASPVNILKLILVFSEQDTKVLHPHYKARRLNPSVAFADIFDTLVHLEYPALSYIFLIYDDVHIVPNDPVATGQDVLRDLQLAGPAVIITEQSEPMIIQPRETPTE